jgi:hypothetical protein
MSAPDGGYARAPDGRLMIEDEDAAERARAIKRKRRCVCAGGGGEGISGTCGCVQGGEERSRQSRSRSVYQSITSHRFVSSTLCTPLPTCRAGDDYDSDDSDFEDLKGYAGLDAAMRSASKSAAYQKALSVKSGGAQSQVGLAH